MNICMVGAGYVGLVSAVCFSEFGWNVACIDKEQKRVGELQGDHLSRARLKALGCKPCSALTEGIRPTYKSYLTTGGYTRSTVEDQFFPHSGQQ
jgi:2-polyprenyl-6-methoxyphenol hydroxylase-like FAD-dependent oxidoreductase